MRRTVLLIGAAGLGALAFASIARPALRLAYNPSASAPRGWYALRAVGAPRIGMRVLAWPPAGAARLADRRGYVPRTVPLLKTIAATGGARLCRHGPAVTIDGRFTAIALIRDHAGRQLPRWHGCRRLDTDELLLLAADRPDSFDGRYFGPVRTHALLAAATPLWTW